MEEDRDGRSGPPWRAGWDLAKGTLLAAHRDRVAGLAAEVAFFLLLALPPGLLALLGGMGYVAEALGPGTVMRVEQQILAVAGTFLTQNTVGEVVEPFLDELLAEGRADVISIGLVVALWSASRATNRFMEAVSLAYGSPDDRPGYRRRLAALGITIVGIVVVVLLLPVLIAGPRLGEFITEPLGVTDLAATLWRFLYWPVIGLLGVAALAMLYHVCPPRGTPWRRDLPGAALAVLLWLAGGSGVRLYARWSIEQATTYGPLAAPIVLLLWLYVTAFALLLGAELNAEIERRWPRRNLEEIFSEAGDQPADGSETEASR